MASHYLFQFGSDELQKNAVLFTDMKIAVELAPVKIWVSIVAVVHWMTGVMGMCQAFVSCLDILCSYIFKVQSEYKVPVHL